MYREVGACWSQHPTRPGRSHRYRPTARADGDAFSAIFDETAGICCSPLIPVSNEGMDLVSTHLFGTIADTAHRLLLHGEMGTSNVTCPTAPPLPARSTGSTRLCDEDRSPRHPKLSCRAAPARSRRATSAPSALLASQTVSPTHVLPLGVDGVCVLDVRAHSPVPATNNCRSRRGPRRPAPARPTPPQWVRRWSTPAWSAWCARTRVRPLGAPP